MAAYVPVSWSFRSVTTGGLELSSCDEHLAVGQTTSPCDQSVRSQVARATPSPAHRIVELTIWLIRGPLTDPERRIIAGRAADTVTDYD